MSPADRHLTAQAEYRELQKAMAERELVPREEVREAGRVFARAVNKLLTGRGISPAARKEAAGALREYVEKLVEG